jgi:hypothetical protein
MKYRIKGSIKYEFRNIKWIEVDQIIDAESSDQAIDMVAEKQTPWEDGELYDTDPDVDAILIEGGSEDETLLNYLLMRSLGPSIAPTLFPETAA